MPTGTANEAAAQDLARLMLDLFTPSTRQHMADAAAHAETQGLIRQLIERFNSMSDDIKTAFAEQDAKIDSLVAAQAAMSERVSAQDAKLAAAEAARDQAVSDLTNTKAALTDAQALLASNAAADIAAVKASLATEGTKLDSVIGALNGVDVAPVPAAPAPVSGETPPATTTTETAATNTDAPAAAAVELAPQPDAPAAAPAAPLQQDSQVSLTA